jgi:hypothetical protein
MNHQPTNQPPLPLYLPPSLSVLQAIEDAVACTVEALPTPGKNHRAGRVNFNSESMYWAQVLIGIFSICKYVEWSIYGSVNPALAIAAPPFPALPNPAYGHHNAAAHAQLSARHI